VTSALTLPDIDPVALALGPFTVRWYALAYIAGILIGWWYSRRLAGNAAIWGAAGPPMKPDDIDDFVVWATIGIVVGGRVGYVLFYDLPHYFAEPGDILAVWHGGMSFHGGFLGTVLAMVLFARRRHIPAWSLIDVIAPAVTFGLFFGRLANFVNGELYGRVTDAAWGVIFCNDYAIDAAGACPAGLAPRHPSQLYEAGLEGLALFLVLRLLTHRYRKLATPGFVSGAFCAGYGIARTTAEFFREPDIQIGYLAGGLTMGMLLSIPMIAFGIGLMVWASRRAGATAAA
jgi:phosphatidylglycerol:prolipoprotein diacylglycerol transferase